jgi:bacteriorhodopsin
MYFELDWICFSSIDHSSILGHYIHFVFLTYGSKVRRSFMYVTWFPCVWVIWKERNNRIFSQKGGYIYHLLDIVKFLMVAEGKIC